MQSDLDVSLDPELGLHASREVVGMLRISTDKPESHHLTKKLRPLKAPRAFRFNQVRGSIRRAGI